MRYPVYQHQINAQPCFGHAVHSSNDTQGQAKPTLQEEEIVSLGGVHVTYGVIQPLSKKGDNQ